MLCGLPELFPGRPLFDKLGKCITLAIFASQKCLLGCPQTRRKPLDTVSRGFPVCGPVATVTDVTEGMYAFVEVSAPAPYATLTEPVIAHVDQATINGGGTVTVTAADKKLPSLSILKRDAQTKEVIPGTVFEVKGIHYGYHNDVTTGPDGKAVLTNIPVDSYEIIEKSVPDPYVVGDEPMQTIYLGPGEERELIFDNLKQPLLTIAKLDADTNDITVLVWKLDRFARNRYDSAHYKSILKKNGVRVVSATEHITEGPEGIILESMLEGMAEYYSAELAEKIRRGQKDNALKCHNNGGPPHLGTQPDRPRRPSR